jgi:protein ImuB
VDPALPKAIIIQLTPTAQSCGVSEGLTASQAMARFAELIIKARSPAQEESATEVLLQTAYAFSSNIESTAVGVCTMELKGLGFGSNGAAAEQWAGKIIEVLAQFQMEAKIGLAATPELALLAARSGTGASPVRFDSRTFESFPISSLEPPPEILELLRRWGIQTIGTLLTLGKDNVAERLGSAAVELFNRVSPDSPRPLKLVMPAEEFSEQMEFENEVETVEPLLFVLRRFVEQLSGRLELIYLVIAEFQLQLGLSSGAKYERLFKIPAPTGNIEILFRMLQTHLETVRTDSPITSLRLAGKPAKPEARQFGLFESTLRDPNQFAETLARLTALIGSEYIGTPQLVASHKPDSFRMAVPEFNSHTSNFFQRGSNFSLSKNEIPPKNSRIELNRSSRREEAHTFPQKKLKPADERLNIYAHPHPGPLPRGEGETSSGSLIFQRFLIQSSARSSLASCGGLDSPHADCYKTAGEGKIGLSLRRFRPPLPSQIEFREEKPSLLRSHVFAGLIVETRGPFFSSGNWWDSGRWAREEWDVETSDGLLLRIFRSSEGCFVEGVYD